MPTVMKLIATVAIPACWSTSAASRTYTPILMMKEDHHVLDMRAASPTKLASCAQYVCLPLLLS